MKAPALSAAAVVALILFVCWCGGWDLHRDHTSAVIVIGAAIAASLTYLGVLACTK